MGAYLVSVRVIDGQTELIMEDFDLDEIAAVHFDGEGEAIVAIGMEDYRKFAADYAIVRSLHSVVEEGDLRSVIPGVREAFAGCPLASGLFVSVRVRLPELFRYDDWVELMTAVRPNAPADGVKILWGITKDAGMEADISVFALAGVKKDA